MSRVERQLAIAVLFGFAIIAALFHFTMGPSIKRANDEQARQREADIVACRAIGGFPILSENRRRLERCER